MSLYPVSATRLFLCEGLDPLVRLLGHLAQLAGRDSEGTESALRGRILGWRRRWRIGRNVRFAGAPPAIRLGERVVFYGNTYLNAFGKCGAISIGEHTHIDQFCVLYGQGGLTIGSECAIASGVTIYSQTNADTMGDGTPVTLQPTTYAPVSIGNGCWLGARVVVLPGVTIGDGCHVGAGAVVTADLPPYSVAVGIPAKVIRERQR
jgi:acetyltransferase-like isoleucine patch superfamily enzyme